LKVMHLSAALSDAEASTKAGMIAVSSHPA
jgi:hypothetical protein